MLPGLTSAVDDAAVVGGIERLGDVDDDPQGFRFAEVAGLGHLAGQVAALDVLHDDVRAARVLAPFDRLDEMGVGDLLGEFGFALEAGHSALVGGGCGVEELDGHVAAVGRAGPKYRPRPPAARLFQEPVAAHEFQVLGEQLGQGDDRLRAVGRIG